MMTGLARSTTSPSLESKESYHSAVLGFTSDPALGQGEHLARQLGDMITQGKYTFSCTASSVEVSLLTHRYRYYWFKYKMGTPIYSVENS